MNFESLAYELLIELFEYFTVTHLFHAFYGLNIRFTQLLVHVQLHDHFNFDSISKTNFDIVSQRYLSININRIKSIHLLDDVETAQHINLFLSYGFQFHQFTYLKCLSLGHIYSEQIMNNIINELHQLHYLTHLKIDKCRVDNDLINDG
ncbi:unnamed protein product [Rotaria sordida]|uniref:Uncharacterized protein n=1 Tax=Rotaria sordida TaxID=392033 RepID=A0A814MVL2_9BILA|nr:unnamed protein product [Rotaria sordida]CAF3735139.1 unnamed protein product [Rotaria sordida]